LFVIAGHSAGLLHSPAPTGGFQATSRVVAAAIKVMLTVPALVPLRELLLASAAERGHDGFSLAGARS
jgi:hypothetical protein